MVEMAKCPICGNKLNKDGVCPECYSRIMAWEEIQKLTEKIQRLIEEIQKLTEEISSDKQSSGKQNSGGYGPPTSHPDSIRDDRAIR